MKKQILLLTFFTLAILFVGMKSYAQVTYTKNLTGAPECVTAQPLNCASTEDALHPLPGKHYTYGVTVNPNTASSIEWFVTDESNIIYDNAGVPTLQTVRDPGNGAGDYILTNSAEYNDAANTKDTINISWQSFDGSTNQVVLVAYVLDAAGCTDNVEVYRIEPTFGFTLDIAALADGGAINGLVDGSLTAEECVSPVESATYDGSNLNMDYGENWIFFSVNAANYVGSWMPDIATTYTGAGTVSAVEWAYPADAQANTNWNAATDPVMAQVAGGAVGPNGECIVLRVQIDHAGDELDAAGSGATLNMGIDGTMIDPATSGYTNTDLQDLDNGANPGDPCVNNYTDNIDYTLTPRPEVTTNTEPGVADQPFEPKAP